MPKWWVVLGGAAWLVATGSGQVLSLGGEFRGELKRGETVRYQLGAGEAAGQVWLEARPSAFQVVWTDGEGKRRRGEVREFAVRAGMGGGTIEVRHDGYPEG